jgi:suppressor of ftsI
LVVALLAAALGCAVALGLAPGGGAQTSNARPPTVPAIPPAPFTHHSPFAEPPVVSSRHGHLTGTLFAANAKVVRISGVDVEQTQTYRATAGSMATARGFIGPTLHLEPGDVLDLVLDNHLVAPESEPPTDGSSTTAAGGHAHGSTQAATAERAHGAARAAQALSPPQFTNLHFHGLHVTPRTRVRGPGHRHFVLGDNVLATLHPGGTHIRFQIPWDHDQGTFWYHAHLHGMTDDQVYRGLAGLLIIGDVRRDLPSRFRHIKTRSLALKDIQVVNAAKADEPARWAIPTDHDWVHPTHRTVNGLVNPRMKIRPGETQLWRLANVSSAVWYRVALVDDAHHAIHDALTVVAQDGNTRAVAERRTSIVLGPGQRFDVLVRGQSSGRRTLMTLPFDQGRRVFGEDVLAAVDAQGAPAPAIAPVHRIGVLPRFPTRRGRTRHFTFNIKGSKPLFTINGRVFDIQRADVRPELGTTETWVITNRSTEWHPFHIHQDDFRVVSVNGRKVHALGDQDVVPLPPVDSAGNPSRVVIEMPFTDYGGKFVFHCHILDHEDGGMMALVDVRGHRTS